MNTPKNQQLTGSSFLKGVMAVLFLLALIGNYHYFSHGYFSHLGISYEPLSLLRSLLLIGTFFSVAMILPNKIAKPSHFLAQVLFMLLVSPVAIVFLTSSPDIGWDRILFLSAVLASLLIIYGFSHARPIRIAPLEVSRQTVTLGIVGTFLAAFLVLFANFGFSMPSSVLEVYEVRLQAREVFSSGPPGLGYVTRWTANALGPCMFLLGLIRKSWIFLLLAVAGQIAIYSFDATKVTLFSLFFVWGAWYLIAKCNAKAWILYAGGTTMLVAIPLVDFALKKEIANFLFVRRIFYMPSAAALMYFETFKLSEFYYWSGSVLSSVLNPPLEYSSPAFLVGSTEFGSSTVSANANYISSAYANAGYLGIILMAVLLGVLSWVYDSITRNSELAFAVALVAVPTFALTNSALPTVFLSHGLLPCLVLAYLVGSADSTVGRNFNQRVRYQI